MTKPTRIMTVEEYRKALKEVDNKRGLCENIFALFREGKLPWDRHSY